MRTNFLKKIFSGHLDSLNNKEIFSWWWKRINYYNYFVLLLITITLITFSIFSPRFINVFTMVLALYYFIFLNLIYLSCAVSCLLFRKKMGTEKISKLLSNFSISLHSLVLIAQIVITFIFINL